jgi:hypothetical protein
MFVDINNSTEMSLSLPEKQFALLVVFRSRSKYICFGLPPVRVQI